jgi:signal transduction histidine kinase
VRGMPDSLFSRLMAALLAVTVLTVLVAGLLIVRERRELAFWTGEAAEFVTVISDTAARLADLPAPEREVAIAELEAEPLSIESEFQRRPGPSPEFIAAALDSYRSRLQRRLGAAYEVRIARASARTDDVISVVRDTPGERTFERLRSRGGPDPYPGGANAEQDPRRLDERDSDGRFRGDRGQLDVSIRLPDGGDLTFRAPIPRAAAALPRQIFAELAVLTLILAAVLYFMTRTITRPLSSLAAAAEGVGRGERLAPLPEVGARELREATRAFNTMQERLHRYFDSRTRVLAAMSHDLRTPLTRLRLRVESIEDESQRERFISDLDEMSSMVSGALSVFRGLNEEEPERECDVGDLLDDLRTEFAEIGITFDVEGKASRPIRVRPRAIKRCLTNLLTNAVKFGRRPRVVVDDGADLIIRVCDDGPGIPAEDLERVFEPFCRLESSRNAETGGTGLGLSIARDIAQAHGGSLLLRNRVPHGLEAVLTLPRAAA